MELAKTLIETFVAGLAATLIVGLIARLGGSKPNWAGMVGIAFGITIAKAIQTQWSISGVAAYFVLGTSVGLCALLAQVVTGKARREA